MSSMTMKRSGVRSAMTSASSSPRAQEFTPPNIAAGSLPDVADNPSEAAWNSACEICGTEKVHMVWRRHGGRIWWIAAPSSDFANSPNTGSRLAAALPGDESHLGDGAYYARTHLDWTVIVKTRHALHCFVGDRKMAESYAADHDAGEVDLEHSDIVPWRQYHLAVAADARTLIASTERLGWIGVKAGIATILSLMVLTAGSSADIEGIEKLRNERTQKAAEAAMQLARHPLYDQLSAMSQAVSVLAETRGIMNFWRISKGALSYDIDLPSWVTQDHIRRLGGEGVVSRDPELNVIHVRKGAP
jgi:hypothetical protein